MGKSLAAARACCTQIAIYVACHACRTFTPRRAYAANARYKPCMADFSSPPAPVPTGLDGFLLWPGFLDLDQQKQIVDHVRDAVRLAPLYRPVTPGGRAFSVRMSNWGPLGWVSDKSGYRYQKTHPLTHAPWPPLPEILLDIWRATANYARQPDACLINFYDADARMGLHQDKDEADFSAPVVSISLGDSAIFRLAPAEGGPSRTVKLSSGDVCVLAGHARLARHGVDRIISGTSQLLPHGGRINLTMRVAQ